jgi:hypothetical protein
MEFTMNIKLLLSLSLLVSSDIVLAMEKPSPEMVVYSNQSDNTKKPADYYYYQNFIQRVPEEIVKHEASDDVKKTLSNLPANFSGISEFSWLPDYIIKNNSLDKERELSRIYGSLLIRHCSQENNYSVVSTPIKYFYNKEHRLYILAEKIKHIDKPFNLKQVQQLYKTSKKTTYWDIHEGNILNTEAGIAYIIDTESRSFCNNKERTKKAVLRYLKDLKIDTDAQRWLEQKTEKHKQVLPHSVL